LYRNTNAKTYYKIILKVANDTFSTKTAVNIVLVFAWMNTNDKEETNY